MTSKIRIERCSTLDQPGWLDMRLALWPDATADDHRGYMAISLAQPERFLQLMMYDDMRQPLAFIEGSIRSDYVNGTGSSPVGFVEGVYVAPAWRRATTRESWTRRSRSQPRSPQTRTRLPAPRCLALP